MAAGSVMVRTGRNVMGQVCVKFRQPGLRDKIINAYPIKDVLKESSYVNLSATYSREQLLNSNLEDLILGKTLELKM